MDAAAVADRIGVDYAGPVGNDKSTVAQFCYWRKPDGSITIGPAWPVEHMRQIEEGFVALTAYGKFLDDDPGIKPDQFKRLLERGGHREFGVRQVLETLSVRYRHRVTNVLDRAALERDFPQLATVTWREVSCGLCTRRFIDCPDLGLLGEHDLAKHESVTHKQTSEHQSLARHLAEANAQNAGPMAKALELLAVAVDGIARRLETIEHQKDATRDDRARRASAVSARGERKR